MLGVIVVALEGCSLAVDPWQGEQGSPRVVVTIAPLYSFVKAVGGPNIPVRCLCLTTGPHHYQADSADSRLLAHADVFFAVGLTLEQFSDRMQAQSGNAHLLYVKLGEELPPDLKRELPEPIQHGDHAHIGFDPHVWLGIDQSRRLVEEIAKTLSRADPANAETYRANAVAYGKRLEELQAEGKKLLATKNRRLITHHDSLHYFASSFGLEVVGVLQKGPGDEPDGRDFADLEQLIVRANKDGRPVQVIAVEPQFPQRTAEILQGLVKDKHHLTLNLVEVDPLETADRDRLLSDGAQWYEKRIQANLNALAAGLP
jgi:ABC-type Zn uptake system ZnuABC Zn-binding protein ZnuA